MEIVSKQLSLLPENEQPRKCMINGEEYASVLDLLRIYGKSINPSVDWRRIKEKLTRQGYDVTELLYYQFRASDGNLKRPTPVVNKVEIARIAQVTDYPEWEPIRQAMAEIFVEQQSSKKPRQLAARKYRQLRNAGYDNDQAMEWHDRDVFGAETFKRATREWKLRDGEIPRLIGVSTRFVLGKSITAWKKEHNTKETPRKYMSSGKKTALAIVENIAVTLHRRRDSQGTDALTEDIKDASGVVDWRKIDELFPDIDLLPPGRAEQRMLPEG